MGMEGPKELSDIDRQIEEQRSKLERMEGEEMKEILDQERYLDGAGAISTISATDPNRRGEYEDWRRSLYAARAANESLKIDLEKRIKQETNKLYKLMSQQREI